MKEVLDSKSDRFDVYKRQFHTLMSRPDKLEEKMEKLLKKALYEVNNRNKPKNLPLTKFFSRFCALKGLKEDHPTARDI